MYCLSPEEKSDELFNHFYETKFGGPGFLGILEAKKEAVYIVDEIVKSLNFPEWDGNPHKFPEGFDTKVYWAKVKECINNISGPDYITFKN